MPSISTKGNTGLRIATIFATMTCLMASFLPAWADREEDLRQGKVVVSTEGKNKEEHFVKARVFIHATPEIVWDTVHKERQHDPDIASCKILSKDNNQCTLEEKFVFLPIFGSATCVMRDEEVPLRKISYKLLKSDHFKAMEGSWILTPADDGRSTILELNSHLDVGLLLPQALMDSVTGHKLEKRLQHVRAMSEEKSNIAQASL